MHQLKNFSIAMLTVLVILLAANMFLDQKEKEKRREETQMFATCLQIIPTTMPNQINFCAQTAIGDEIILNGK